MHLKAQQNNLNLHFTFSLCKTKSCLSTLKRLKGKALPARSPSNILPAAVWFHPVKHLLLGQAVHAPTVPDSVPAQREAVRLWKLGRQG